MQSGGHAFAILTRVRTPLHMHNITSCAFCFLFAVLLLSLLLDCLFPSLFCQPEEMTSAAGCLNISTQGKQLESSINDFYIPHTSLILLPHAGYMTHPTALQVLRLPNNSYKNPKLSVLLSQCTSSTIKSEGQSPEKKMGFNICTACVNFRVTQMCLQCVYTVPPEKVFRELHLQKAS